MNWQKINKIRWQSDVGYFVEALGVKGNLVYVVWLPVAEGDRLFKWPHRVVAAFSHGSDQEKAEKAKQFCEQHFEQGNKNAA